MSIYSYNNLRGNTGYINKKISSNIKTLFFLFNLFFSHSIYSSIESKKSTDSTSIESELLWLKSNDDYFKSNVKYLVKRITFESIFSFFTFSIISIVLFPNKKGAFFIKVITYLFFSAIILSTIRNLSYFYLKIYHYRTPVNNLLMDYYVDLLIEAISGFLLPFIIILLNVIFYKDSTLNKLIKHSPISIDSCSNLRIVPKLLYVSFIITSMFIVPIITFYIKVFFLYDLFELIIKPFWEFLVNSSNSRESEIV